MTLPISVRRTLAINEEARAAIKYFNRTGHLPDCMSLRAFNRINDAVYGSPFYIEPRKEH